MAPAIHGWSGLQLGRLLIDRASNKIMAVSFWDSQADEASLQSSAAYKEQVGKFGAPVRWSAISKPCGLPDNV